MELGYFLKLSFMEFMKKIISFFAILALTVGTVSANNDYKVNSSELSDKILDFVMDLDESEVNNVTFDNVLRDLDVDFNFENATKEVRNRYDAFATAELFRAYKSLSASEKKSFKSVMVHFDNKFETYKERKKFYVQLNNRINAFYNALDAKIKSNSCAGACKTKARYQKKKYANLLTAVKYHGALVLLSQSYNDDLVNEVAVEEISDTEKAEVGRIVKIADSHVKDAIKDTIKAVEEQFKGYGQYTETGDINILFNSNFGKAISGEFKFSDYKAVVNGLNSIFNSDMSMKLDAGDEGEVELSAVLDVISHNLVSYFKLSNLDYSTSDEWIKAVMEQVKALSDSDYYLTDNAYYKKFAKFAAADIEEIIPASNYEVLGKKGGLYVVREGKTIFTLKIDGGEYTIVSKDDRGDFELVYDKDAIKTVEFVKDDAVLTYDKIEGFKFDVSENGTKLYFTLSKDRRGEYRNMSFRFYKAPEESSHRPVFITVSVNDAKLKVDAQIPTYDYQYVYNEEEFDYTYTSELESLTTVKMTGSFDSDMNLVVLNGDLNVVDGEGDNVLKGDVDYSKNIYLKMNLNGTLDESATVAGKVDFKYSGAQFDNGLIDFKIVDLDDADNKFVMTVKASAGKIEGKTYLTSAGNEIFKVDTTGEYSSTKFVLNNKYVVSMPNFFTGESIDYFGNLNFAYNGTKSKADYSALFDLSVGEIELVNIKLNWNFKRDYNSVVPEIKAPEKVKLLTEMY